MFFDLVPTRILLNFLYQKSDFGRFGLVPTPILYRILHVNSPLVKVENPTKKVKSKLINFILFFQSMKNYFQKKSILQY